MRRLIGGTILAIALGATALMAACDAGAPRGIVSAATPEAAEAGARILAAGGNAVDAAVAVSFALAVTEPAMSGLGAQTQILIAEPGREPVIVNGTSRSPANTPTDAAAGAIAGHRATTIPSMVRTLDHAWRMHGSAVVDWPELLAPAIGCAESGFVVGPFRHRVWEQLADQLRADPAVAALFLDEDGSPPAAGDTFRQPVLARTLRRLAEQGAADFYTGEIARTIARDMEQHGGWVTYEDLASFAEPQEIAPLHGTYRGRDIYTMPPPGGGWVVLQILNLLELAPATELQIDSPERLQHLVSALRIGHRERHYHPVTDLVDFQADVGHRISKEAARKLAEREERGETTHFTVVDGDGMVVSVTASINNFFGARAAAPDLGFLYNDYMHEFELDDSDHPFALRPGAMPYSSMTPTVVLEDGRPVLGLGSPGSSRIISAVSQVLQLWIDTDIGIAGAVAAGRVHVVPDSLLYVEPLLREPGLEAAFTARGFALGEPRAYLAAGELSAYFGGVHAVAFERGHWRGAADPRRDGRVLEAR